MPDHLSYQCATRSHAMSIILLTVCLFATLHTTRTYTMGETKLKSTAGKPDWKAKTKGYESSIFYFGKNPGMQNTFVETDAALKDYIGIKLSTNTLASRINNRLTIEDIEPPRDFRDEDEMNAAFQGSVLSKYEFAVINFIFCSAGSCIPSF